MTNELKEAAQRALTVAKEKIEEAMQYPNGIAIRHLLGAAWDEVARVEKSLASSATTPEAAAQAEGREQDRDAAIRIWQKHCAPFAWRLGDTPPSPAVDAMLEFAAISTQPVQAHGTSSRIEDAYREGFRDAATFKNVDTAWKLSVSTHLTAPAVDRGLFEPIDGRRTTPADERLFSRSSDRPDAAEHPTSALVANRAEQTEPRCSSGADDTATPAEPVAPGGVPSGWALVPSKATDEMVLNVYLGASVTGLDDFAIREIWDAMLEAAPPAIAASAPSQAEPEIECRPLECTKKNCEVYGYCEKEKPQTEGGRGSLDEALMIIESWGPGTGGLNDTFARQILLADEVRRLRAEMATAQNQLGWLETKSVKDVLAERQRQFIVEGWTPEHDDEHGHGEMAIAAACYALDGQVQNQAGAEDMRGMWKWTGWSDAWFKPTDTRRNLIKAGALILAEIERLDRAASSTTAGERE